MERSVSKNSNGSKNSGSNGKKNKDVKNVFRINSEKKRNVCKSLKEIDDNNNYNNNEEKFEAKIIIDTYKKIGDDTYPM